MLNIRAFTFNPFQENTYIIFNEDKQCWIIDPGMYDNAENAELFSFISEHELKPQAIINTHTHIDHIMGAQATMNKYNIPFGIHEQELPVLRMAAGSAVMFGLDFAGGTPNPSFFIKEGTFPIGTDQLQVFHTPGHSTGSISFYYPEGKWVVSGDVLFSGSIGRTDLPGGNFETLINSIRSSLFTLPGETVVFSGHGPSTTIAEEQAHNPFLQ